MDHADFPSPREDEVVQQPRTIVFDQIVCPEDPDITLDEQDLAIRREGFDRYRRLFSPALSNEQRQFLLSQDVLSITAGFQAEATMSDPFIAAWINAMNRAGIDYTQEYGVMYDSGQYYNRKTEQVEQLTESFWDLINLRQMEHVLSSNRQLFGLDDSVKFPMTKDELLQHYVRIRSEQDDKQFHIRIGLLSGYPLGDCYRWNEDDSRVYRPAIGLVKPAAHSEIQQLDAYMLSHPDVFPVPGGKVDDTFFGDINLHPDTRGVKNQDPNLIYVGSYGVGWATKLTASGDPPRDTIEHCQRLLNIDKQLGIDPFVTSQKALLASGPRSGL
jgi:hypothetical protein